MVEPGLPARNFWKPTGDGEAPGDLLGRTNCNPRDYLSTVSPGLGLPLKGHRRSLASGLWNERVPVGTLTRDGKI